MHGTVVGVNTWGMRGTVAAIGISAVVAGVGGAAIYAATGDGPRLMGMQHGPGPSIGGHGGGPDSATLHGEFVVADGAGGFTTTISQTGRITAISATSVTARSDDGYSQTYVIAALGSTVATSPPFVVNDEVTIRATRTGQTVSVSTIDYARTGGGRLGPPPVAGHS